MADYVPNSKGDEKGRHLDRSSKRQMKSSQAKEKEGSGCLLLVILKVVKDEKEITMS